MEPNRLLTISVLTFLPLLAFLRGYYGFLKYKQFGENKHSILNIAKMDPALNKKLVLIARSIIGISCIGYSIIIYAIFLVRNQ